MSNVVFRLWTVHKGIYVIVASNWRPNNLTQFNDPYYIADAANVTYLDTASIWIRGRS